ncbi:hypothetical protein [Proteus phage RP7]|nr:hypothetical protein [Proteus phage RP7]
MQSLFCTRNKLIMQYIITGKARGNTYNIKIFIDLVA